jgi:hypothetical protein
MELAVSHCRQAARFMSAGQPRRAAQMLRKVATILPKAGWLDTAITQAEKAAEAMDALCTGPLGLGVCDSGPAAEHGAAVEQEYTPSFEKDDNNRGSALPKATSGARTQSQLPSKFILQVDGVGSFLVLRGQSVTVGPISSSVRPALGLLADPHLPVATIERSDEDYFVRSQKPIYVNDRPVTEKLLDNGDHIALSARCRMKFCVPNVASTTATLTLSSGRLPRPDINHIILMDRDILMGPGFNNHVSTDRLLDNVTLLVQNGYLLCRAKERPVAAGRPLDLQAGLPMNTPIKIGRISLVLAKLEE